MIRPDHIRGGTKSAVTPEEVKYATAIPDTLQIREVVQQKNEKRLHAVIWPYMRSQRK